MTLLTKYSDYTIHPIEYWISAIRQEFEYRDISGLTLGKIELVEVSKQHPLVALFSSAINPNSTNPLESGVWPMVSVTPSSPSEKAFTLGHSFNDCLVDDNFADRLRYFLDKTDAEIQREVMISKDQIETILAEYQKCESPHTTQRLICRTHTFSKGEELNISVWTTSADYTTKFEIITESALTSIQTGNDQKIRDVDIKVQKGLTNFQYGRVLYGSEYILTFLNSYSNYEIYVEQLVTGHELHYAGFTTPGAPEDIWQRQ